MESTHFIVVQYQGYPEWPSPKRFDERVEKLLRKTSDGSGCGFGGRDFSFSFTSYEKAKAAAAKVRTYAKKEKESMYRKATVKVYKYQD